MINLVYYYCILYEIGVPKIEMYDLIMAIAFSRTTNN